MAAGLSNKEVAGQLYLSVYTVQAHLTRAYAKLGVRSRAQLARRLGGSVYQGGGPAPVQGHWFE